MLTSFKQYTCNSTLSQYFIIEIISFVAVEKLIDFIVVTWARVVQVPMLQLLCNISAIINSCFCSMLIAYLNDCPLVLL